MSKVLSKIREVQSKNSILFQGMYYKGSKYEYKNVKSGFGWFSFTG